MPIEVTRLTGNEWQEWGDQLLCRHYGATEYQKIPAKDRGDAGIEGFTVSGGHAYQCYGCDDPIPVKHRYESQRDKMTEDIKKFINNKPKLLKVLGKTQISRWCLFVPMYDSRFIVEHAAAKTEEVKQHKLPYVTSNFRVMVVDEAAFSKERDELLAVRPALVEVTGKGPTEKRISGWTSANDTLVDKLDEKIAQLPTIKSPEHRQQFRDGMIQHFLHGQNVLKALKDSYPTIYARLTKLKSSKEMYLKTLSSVTTGNPAEILTGTIAKFRSEVDEEQCRLGTSTADAVTYEAVADWLLRCPLHFPNGS